MISKVIDQMAFNPPKELQALIKLMNIIQDNDAYRKLINDRFGKRPTFEQQKGLSEAGGFPDKS